MQNISQVSLTPMETTNITIASTAVTSPAWLPWLQNVSEVAAMLAPILGAIWLIVQIYSKISEHIRKRKDED